MRADEDRVDFGFFRELDHVIADAAEATNRAWLDAIIKAELLHEIARDQLLDFEMTIDRHAVLETVVLRSVIWVVDRAEHDVDVAALAERVRPLNSEVTCDGIVDAEEQTQRPLAT